MLEKKNRNILIVDDVPANIQMVGNILRHEGFDISFAENGQSALDIIHYLDYDLILLDIMMPVMNGIDVCKELKKNQRTKDIPIIFLTAKTDEESIKEGFEAGGVDYITKPFHQNELLARVRTHIALREKEKRLNEVNAMKDKIFSVISHDLKSPFINIINYLNLIHDETPENVLKLDSKIFENLYHSTQNAYTLLTNLLDWSRSQSGALKMNINQQEINESIIMCLDLLVESANQKKIKLLFEPYLDVYVMADEYMLNTILRNLIGNAIKFTPYGGTVRVEIKELKNFVEVKIIDTGIGLSDEEVEQLFRFDNSISKRGTGGEKGTGLGLILCNDFIKKHNSTIQVQSIAGKGSIFSFKLQRAIL